jgi:Skp family chaperone for outer membrane proteins
MKTNRTFVAIVVSVVCCVIVVWFSTSIQGSQKTYEIHPNVNVPEYSTDINRIVNAYERLMERYMNLTEKNLTNIERDLKNTAAKLDSIENKLTELSARTARIEEALGIEQERKSVAKGSRN